MPSTDSLILFTAALWIVARHLDSRLGTISSRDDEAHLVIWCVFSGFFNEVDSWGYVGFLYCLAEIFVGFFGGFCWDFLEISL